MIWISAEDVIRLHSQVIQSTGGLDGIHDRSVLESALCAPLQPLEAKNFFLVKLKRLQDLAMDLPATMPLLMEINVLAHS